jgi:hypothetical protein
MASVVVMIFLESVNYSADMVALTWLAIKT